MCTTNADYPAVKWVGHDGQRQENISLRLNTSSEEVDLPLVCRIEHSLVADNAVAVRVWAVKPRTGSRGDRIDLTTLFKSGQLSQFNYAHIVGWNPMDKPAEIPFLMYRFQRIDYAGIPTPPHLCFNTDDMRYSTALSKDQNHGMFILHK